MHIASWKVGYRGVFPDEYLDALRVDDRLAYWEQRLGDGRDTRDHILVVEDAGGAVVGFAAGGPAEGAEIAAAVVRQLYVHPAMWGQGFGRALLEELVSRLRADASSSAVLWVSLHNSRARRLYEAAGWTSDGVQKRECHWGAEATSMRYRFDLRP